MARKKFQFGFEIVADAEKGTKTLKRVKEEITGLQSTTNNARTRTREWRRETDEQTKSLERQGQMIERGRKLLLGMAGAMGLGMGARELVRYTDQWSDLNSMLINATGSQVLADQAMASISATARSTYSSLEQTATSFLRNNQTLKELNFTMEQQLSLSDAINNSLVISGTKAQEAESVQNALSRAFAIGELRGQNFNTVVASGGRLVQALAEGLGVTTIELRAMAEDGLLTTSRVADALISQMPVLREEADRMPATVSDGILLMGNATLELVGRMDQAIGSSAAVSEAMKEVADTIRDFAADPERLARGLDLATKAGTLFATLLAARMVPSIIAATVAKAGAIQQSAAYQAALARMTIAASGATVAQRSLATATAAASGALGLLGGPVGIAVIAAGAMFAFRSELGLVPWSADRARNSIELLTDSIADMNHVQLDQQRWIHTDGLAAAQREIEKITRSIESQEALLKFAGSRTAVNITRELADLRAELQETTELAKDHAFALKLVEEAMERLANPIAQASGATSGFTDKVTEMIAAIEEETKQLRMSSAEIEIQKLLREAEELATSAGGQAIIAAIEAREEERRAIEEETETRRLSERAIEDERKAREKSVAQNASTIRSIEQRIEALGRSARANFIAAEMAKLSEDATREQRMEVFQAAAALYDLEWAQQLAGEAAKELAEAQKSAAEESARAAKQIADDWLETRRAFGEFFADLVQDGESAFDALLKSWERMLLEMTGQLALSGILKVFNVNVPGNSAAGIQGVLDSSGIAGVVTGSLIDRFGAIAAESSGIADIMAAFSKPLAGPVRPGETLGGFNGELLANGLKTLGLSIGAGFAGDLAGGALGEALFGKEAESSIGSAVLGAIGTAMGGPLGSFIGASIGAMVDVATGGDGKVRQNAGMLVAPTPGVDPSRTFSVDPFTSGLKVTGFARRTDQAAATQVIDTFREIDAVVAALIKELDGQLDLTKSTLAGLDEEATAGSLGTFLGLGGNGRLAGDLMQQLGMFVDQLLGHASGLSDELIETARAAGTAEEKISVLAAAVVEQGMAAEEAARMLEESTRAAEELRRVEERLLMYRIDSIGQIAGEIQAATALQGAIQSSIYEALGATPMREFDQTVEGQLARIAEHRSILVQQHQDQMRAELALHNQRMAYARSLGEYATSLRLGEMSNLTPAEQLEYAKSNFHQLALAAEEGDLQAVGQLQRAADQYIAAADEMWASTTPRENAVNEVLAVMDRLALSLAISDFDPAWANERLVSQLEELNRQTEEINAALNESIINELNNISVVLGELGPQVQGALVGAVSQWVDSSTPSALQIIASLGGIKGSVDDLPRSIALYLSDAMGTWISAELAKGVRPEIIADQISKGGLDESAADMYLEKNSLGKVDDYRSARNPDISAGDIAEHVNQIIANSVTEAEAVRRIYAESQAAGVGSKQLADAIGIAQQEVLDLTDKFVTSQGGAYNGQATLQDIAEHVAHIISTSATEEEAVRRIHADALSFGVNSSQLAQALGVSQQEILRDAAKFGLPSFSGGGIARGPESGYLSVLHGTEAVIPLDTGGAVPVRMDMHAANDALVNEVRTLRSELVELKRTVQNVGLDAARQRDEQKRITSATHDDISRLATRRVSGNIG